MKNDIRLKNYKYFLIIPTCILLAMLLVYLITSHSIADNYNPEVIYMNNNSIDLFVYNDVSYVNISDVGWVSKLVLEKDELIGTIQRTGITKNFRDWDSTLVDAGTSVYTMKDNNDILLIEKDGVIIPYLAYMEG